MLFYKKILMIAFLVIVTAQQLFINFTDKDYSDWLAITLSAGFVIIMADLMHMIIKYDKDV